jgi:hypothetical protein
MEVGTEAEFDDKRGRAINEDVVVVGGGAAEGWRDKGGMRKKEEDVEEVAEDVGEDEDA